MPANVERFSPADMIAYLTDCTLATVCDMAMKKRVPKCEYERQQSIAQQGIKFLMLFGWPRNLDKYRSRPYDVIKYHGGNVAEYAAKIRNECYGGKDAV